MIFKDKVIVSHCILIMIIIFKYLVDATALELERERNN